MCSGPVAAHGNLGSSVNFSGNAVLIRVKGTSRVTGVGEHECPGHVSVSDRGCALLLTALLVFGNKMDCIAVDGSLQLVATKISRKFSRLFLQMHLVEKRRFGP